MKSHPSVAHRVFALSMVPLALLLLAVEPTRAADSLELYYPIVDQFPSYLQNLPPQNVPANQVPNPNSTGSGVAYWPARNSFLLLDNNPRRLLEFSRNHNYVRTIALGGFLDPEDIHWLGDPQYPNRFVISHEFNSGSVDELVVIDVPTDSTPMNISGAIRRLTLGGYFTTTANKGIEAVAVVGTNFYFTTEKAPTGPAGRVWSVWTTPNPSSGPVTVPVTPTVAFNMPTLVNDISGMATDGAHLWLLSHEGSGSEASPLARVLRFTTSGMLVADYSLPSFPGNVVWRQAEGIDLFEDPADARMKIVITGEYGNAGVITGVDLMIFTEQTVTASAPDAMAVEDAVPANSGVFRVTRSGGNTLQPLTVGFTLNGTAIHGTDFTVVTGSGVTYNSGTSSGTAVIPTGLDFKDITISPVNDSTTECDETVVLAVSISSVYGVGSPNSAAVTITDEDSLSIISFSPSSGPIGAALTINGSGFSSVASQNIVYFGAVRANVVTATPTALAVTVPVGSTYAPVTVTVNCQTAWSQAPFTVTFTGSPLGCGSLGARLDFGTGAGPIQTIVADLDGDGKADVAVANTFDSTISIFKNTSTGGSLDQNSLTLVATLAAGANPDPYSAFMMVAADVDGDGKLDLITANHQANTVSVIRNTSTPGSFSFASKMDLPVGNIAVGVAVRDLDGDGRPEIVTANYGDNTASVLRNLSSPGTVAFDSKVDFNTGPQPHSVALGDLDGGKPELVVGNSGDHTVSVFRNTSSVGSISLAPPVVVTAGGNTVSIGDWDGDGKADLVTGSWPENNISLVRNTSTAGNITFDPAVEVGIGAFTHTVALTDLDGDGKIDLAAVSEMDSHLLLYRNQSTPGSITQNSLSAPVLFGTGYNAVGVALGDLDGDGRPDVVFANTYDNSISAYRNLLVPSAINCNSFGARLDFGTGGGPIQTVVADFDLDEDHKADVAVANTFDSTISIFKNTSTGSSLDQNSLTLVATLAAGANPDPYSAFMMVAADVDGDGKLDLITANHQANTVSVIRNTSTPGSFSFASKMDLPVGNIAVGVAVRDLDGDGRPEIVTANYGDNTASVLRNLSSPGTVAFDSKVDFNTGPQPHSVALGDLDGGKPELVVGNSGDHTVSVFRNTSSVGSISLAPPVVVTAGGNTVAIGDWDGDGKADLVTGSWLDYNISLVRNTSTAGNITFDPAVEVGTGGATHTVAMGDLDGDGKPDLAVVSELPDQLLLYRNQSTPGSITQNSLSGPVVLGTGWNAVGVSLGDLDGDGRLDVLFGNTYDNFISVYENLIP